MVRVAFGAMLIWFQCSRVEMGAEKETKLRIEVKTTFLSDT